MSIDAKVSTSTTTPTRTRAALVRGAATGAVAGVLASMMMAAYAMVAAATYQDSGFFTPLYHIASVFISPDHMMSSMKSASMDASNFEFFAGPALLGAVIHMMVAAMFGAGFGMAVAVARIRGMALVAAGVLWGALVFAVSSFAGLPLASALLDSGDQITHMARMVGYGTFLVEHLIFGLFLGVLLLMRTQRAH